MASDLMAVRTAYRKLLSLYPYGFRTRLGESMEQTFNDLCIERQRQRRGAWLGFVLWTFIDTTIGIIREHISSLKEIDLMRNNTLTNFTMAALMSFLVLLPFMFMEWVNRQSLRATGKEEFPIPLFIFLFVYGLAFIFMVVTLVRSFRARKDGSTSSEPEAGNTMTKLLARPRQIETIVLILALPFLAALALALLGVELPGDPNGLDFFDTVLPLGTFALVLTATFISTTSIARTVRVQGRLLAQPVSLILVTLMLVLLPLGWGGFVIDQWPCFVGIPMCD